MLICWWLDYLLTFLASIVFLITSIQCLLMSSVTTIVNCRHRVCTYFLIILFCSYGRRKQWLWSGKNCYGMCQRSVQHCGPTAKRFSSGTLILRCRLVPCQFIMNECKWCILKYTLSITYRVCVSIRTDGVSGFVTQAGLFYLKHANAVEGQVPTSELHSILLLALQWLSGSLNSTSP